MENSIPEDLGIMCREAAIPFAQHGRPCLPISVIAYEKESRTAVFKITPTETCSFSSCMKSLKSLCEIMGITLEPKPFGKLIPAHCNSQDAERALCKMWHVDTARFMQY